MVGFSKAKPTVKKDMKHHEMDHCETLVYLPIYFSNTIQTSFATIIT